MVEFVGRAGVGKSTIARQLVATLRGRGIEARSVSGQEVPLWGRVAMPDALRASRIVRALELPWTWSYVHRSLSLYKEFVKLRYAHRRPGLTVLDQGWLQKIEPMKLMHTPDERRRIALRRAMADGPFADLVVAVLASPEALTRRRIASRRADTTLELEVVARRVTTDATIEDVRALQAEGRARAVRLEVVANEVPGDVELVTEELALVVEKLLDASRFRASMNAAAPRSGG